MVPNEEMDVTRAAEGLYALGHELLESSRWHDASDVFRLMATIRPSDERGWLALGGCHEALGQPAIARELYGTACAIAKPAPRCAIAYARCARAMGDDALADEMLERAEEAAEKSGADEILALVAHERRRS